MYNWQLTPEQIAICEIRAKDKVDLDFKKADYTAKVELGIIKPKSTVIQTQESTQPEPQLPDKESWCQDSEPSAYIKLTSHVMDMLEPKISKHVDERDEVKELEIKTQVSKFVNSLQQEQYEKKVAEDLQRTLWEEAAERERSKIESRMKQIQEEHIKKKEAEQALKEEVKALAPDSKSLFSKDLMQELFKDFPSKSA